MRILYVRPEGQIIIDKEELEDECGEMDADELMMTALDAGAEDFNEEEDSFEIITAPDDFSAVREALESRDPVCRSTDRHDPADLCGADG